MYNTIYKIKINLIKKAIMKLTTYKYSGFFLIELLVAIGIFGGLCLLVSQFHWQIIAQEYDSRKYIEAVNLASTIIDEISVSKGKYTNSFKHNSFTILIEPLVNTNKDNKLKSFQSNNITISWKSLNSKKQKIVVNFGIII